MSNQQQEQTMTESRDAALAAISFRFGFTIDQTLVVPAVFDKFAEVAGLGRLCRELIDNAALADYFREVVEKVAASPEGRQIAADYHAARV